MLQPFRRMKLRKKKKVERERERDRVWCGWMQLKVDECGKRVEKALIKCTITTVPVYTPLNFKTWEINTPEKGRLGIVIGRSFLVFLFFFWGVEVEI